MPGFRLVWSVTRLRTASCWHESARSIKGLNGRTCTTLHVLINDRLSAPPNDLAVIPPNALQRQKAASGAIPAGKGRAGGSTR